MKISYILFILLASCYNKTPQVQDSGKQHHRDTLKEKVVYSTKRDTINKIDTAIIKIVEDSKNINFDKTFSGVEFYDEESLVNTFGNLYTMCNIDDDFINIISKDGKQVLRLHHEHGGGQNSFDRVIITFQKKYKYCDKSNVYEFVTESNIKLGISKKKFYKNIYDRKLNKKMNGDTLVLYTNYPESYFYEGIYKFTNDKLVWFSYGYLTP